MIGEGDFLVPCGNRILRVGATALASMLMSLMIELSSDSSCSLRFRLELTVYNKAITYIQTCTALLSIGAVITYLYCSLCFAKVIVDQCEISTSDTVQFDDPIRNVLP